MRTILLLADSFLKKIGILKKLKVAISNSSFYGATDHWGYFISLKVVDFEKTEDKIFLLK